MPRKIIIQERVGEPSDFNFRFVMWADVPLARRAYFANAEALSAVKDVTAEELQAIRSGAVMEQIDMASFPEGTSAAVIKQELISTFQKFQEEVNSRNPFRFFGTSWDGTTWTNAGVN